MRKGFIYDADLCVSCQACSAACTLENGFQPGIRTILTWNGSALPLLSVINLSMACNHCAEAACHTGCPAAAYTISPEGVVIHHPERCMGCGYCTWRCPYEAPQMNQLTGVIEKCSFCAERAGEGVEPACVTACPTGALKMGLRERFDDVMPTWLPDAGLVPSLILRGVENRRRPEIIPADVTPFEELAAYLSDRREEIPYDSPAHDPEVQAESARRVSGGKNQAGIDRRKSGRKYHLQFDEKIRKEWSLVLFSLLAAAASVMIILPVLKGEVPHGILPPLLMTGALAASLTHLGRPGRAWRSVSNILRSPLSREIAMMIILTLLSVVNWLAPGLVPPAVTALTALLTLITIDLVYFTVDRSAGLRVHSGQILFTALFTAAWFAGMPVVFFIFTMLAAFSVVRRYGSAGRSPAERTLYYTRAMALPLVFLLIYPGTLLGGIAATLVCITGVIADRLLFYYDFNPPNTVNSIEENLNREYEKERNKQRQDTYIP